VREVREVTHAHSSSSSSSRRSRSRKQYYWYHRSWRHMPLTRMPFLFDLGREGADHQRTQPFVTATVILSVLWCLHSFVPGEIHLRCSIQHLLRRHRRPQHTRGARTVLCVLRIPRRRPRSSSACTVVDVDPPRRGCRPSGDGLSALMPTAALVSSERGWEGGGGEAAWGTLAPLPPSDALPQGVVAMLRGAMLCGAEPRAAPLNSVDETGAVNAMDPVTGAMAAGSAAVARNGGDLEDGGGGGGRRVFAPVSLQVGAGACKRGIGEPRCTRTRARVADAESKNSKRPVSSKGAGHELRVAAAQNKRQVSWGVGRFWCLVGWAGFLGLGGHGVLK